MTEVAQKHLGNVNSDSVLAQKVTTAKQTNSLLEVSLSKSDRTKGRIFTQSKGLAIGIIKDRALKLQEGDVFQTQNNHLLLIHLKTETLMVLDFTQLADSDLTIKLVRLGHLLGNQHYSIEVEIAKIYVRVSTDDRVITKMIEDLAIEGLKISWQNKVFESDNAIATDHHH